MSNIIQQRVRPGKIRRRFRRQVQNVTSRFEKNYSGKRFVMVWEGSRNAKQVGIFMNGGCDLPAVFTAVPTIRKKLNGTAAIYWHGSVSNSHTSLLLQSLQSLPDEQVQPTQDKLNLPPTYFKPILFEPTFAIPHQNTKTTFQKNVVIFSIGPDIVRTLYRHKEHGLLVDPGGYWLNRSLADIMADRATTFWFRKNFSSLGLIDVETFSQYITKIVARLRQQMDATILIFNVLTVEPGDWTHNYQLQKSPYELRRREFCYALTELSRKLDFNIVDVDRTLKRAGLRETQMDFAHYPDEVYPYIGQEVFRILQALEIL
jgi:hypothetical protein